jgi:hypothetical protein
MHCRRCGDNTCTCDDCRIFHLRRPVRAGGEPFGEISAISVLRAAMCRVAMLARPARLWQRR